MEWTKLPVAVSDVGEAPRIEDLAWSEGGGHDEELAREADATIWAVLLASATRRVAPTTIEPELHLTLPPT